MRSTVTSMVNAGDVDPVFLGRPADYSDEETVKVIVLMTDGMNVDQYRIKSWAYDSTSDRQFWARYTLWYYLNNFIRSRDRSDYYFRDHDDDEADDRLADICEASRNAGIVIFTIGFEIANNQAARAVMNDCATSDSHFYAVEGVEISDAFGAIARTINQLRLIQ